VMHRSNQTSFIRLRRKLFSVRKLASHGHLTVTYHYVEITSSITGWSHSSHDRRYFESCTFDVVKFCNNSRFSNDLLGMN